MPNFTASIALFAALVLAANSATGQTSSLTLGDAARIAGERGGSTTIARARASQADARVGQRRAALLPSLTTTAQFSARTTNSSALGINLPVSAGQQMFDPRGEILGPIHNTDARTQLSLRVFDAPTYLKWRASGTEATAAHFSVAAASDGAAERGATSFIRVVRAEARIAARAADSVLATELLDIARQQVNAGVGIALDVTRAEAQLADARARLIATRSERERSMLSLRQELTLPIDAPLELSGGLDDTPTEQPAVEDSHLIYSALSRRADYQEALTITASNATLVRAARAELLPAVSLFADHGLTGRNFEQQKGTYSYGVQVSVPMFDGLARSSRVREQRSRLQESDAKVADTKRQIETQVRSAVLTLNSTREELAATRVRLRLAEQEVAQARELFRSGVSGSADVINASIALNSARDLVIDAQTNYQLARVALASAQGDMSTLK